MRTFLVVVAATALTASVASAGKARRHEQGADAQPDDAKARRQEVDRLQKLVFREPLLARGDVHVSGPPPRDGHVVELADGSFYEMKDPTLAFEALGPVAVQRMSLRKDGRILMVILAPPSRIVPDYLARGGGAEHLSPTTVVDLDVDDAGGVQQALESLVYLPGTQPSEDAVATCLARYPGQDEKRARLRCGGQR